MRRSYLLLAVVIAIFGLLPTAHANAEPVVEPQSDAFYLPPPDFAATPPGAVLRTRSVPLTFYGLPTPLLATQALFRTSDSHGAPVTTATTLVLPSTPWPSGNRPLMSYQIAIDGLAARCDPSYRLRVGTEGDLRVILQLLQQGYAVAVTDHQGPRHAYGAGPMSAHATLDGIRAVESLPGTGLAGRDTPVGMWGYSGGALATGWAAQTQPSYAPELRVFGVAAGGTPADLRAAAHAMDGGIASSVFLMGVVGASREYPELETLRSLLNDRGRDAENVLRNACIEDGAIAYPFRRFADFTDIPDPIDDPRIAGFFDRLKLGGAAPTAPVYLYHAVHDEGMPFAAAQQLARDWCSGGANVDFVAHPLADHIVLAVAAIPDVLRFFADRAAGRSAPNHC